MAIPGEIFKEENKGTTSKLLEVVLEEKRREIIKEWINSRKIEDINNQVKNTTKN